MSDVIIRAYLPTDNQKALEIERLSPQGKTVKIRFSRPRFEARALAYQKAELFCAEKSGELAGVAAIAKKRVLSKQGPLTASYLFDLRVHPQFRSLGIARLLHERRLLSAQDTDLAYALVVADNARAIHLFEQMKFKNVSDQRLLVFSVSGWRSGNQPLLPTDWTVLRERYTQHGDKSIWQYPERNYATLGDVGLYSNKNRTAFAGVWSNQSIMIEVVLEVSLKLRVLGTALHPFRRLLPVPPVPTPGKEIPSWYIHSFSTEKEVDTLPFLRSLLDLARDRGVEYLYIPMTPLHPRYDLLKKASVFEGKYIVLAQGKSLPNNGSNSLELEIIDW